MKDEKLLQDINQLKMGNKRGKEGKIIANIASSVSNLAVFRY